MSKKSKKLQLLIKKKRKEENALAGEKNQISFLQSKILFNKIVLQINAFFLELDCIAQFFCRRQFPVYFSKKVIDCTSIAVS